MSKYNDVALIVIDVQKGVFNKKTKIFKEMELIDNINALVDAFHNHSLQVYFVRHTNSTMLAENTDDWQLHPDLHVKDGDVLLNKQNSSVFKEKALQTELDKAGVRHIVIAGLVTHGCVKAACQDGKKLGFEVTLASDAHSSFNKDAENLIAEWNEKLAAEGVNIASTRDISGWMDNM